MHDIKMQLSDKDITTAEALEERLNAQNKAQVVSASMAIALSLGKIIDEGELILRKPGGETEKIVFPGLERQP